ncbi:hypothetical protein G7Y89_g12863 [Cudoniella acicularis]|uniref:Uncharacterized protein n=1 Tax=Cudoniella acicularis TaxID=354080 RepID=A0A8H4R9L4_9HELO|nr:hypothetical protein G7Y89_g12863 [Cudoniella acicularis]
MCLITKYTFKCAHPKEVRYDIKPSNACEPFLADPRNYTHPHPLTSQTEVRKECHICLTKRIKEFVEYIKSKELEEEAKLEPGIKIMFPWLMSELQDLEKERDELRDMDRDMPVL